MASGWTNKGKYLTLGYVFRADSEPTNMYVTLLTSTTTPDADDDSMTDVTEVADGSGYSAGGYQVTPGATDFDTHTEVDASDYALVQLKDIQWTASGGSISGARWASLTDDNATPANRLLICWWDLSEDRTVSDGQSLTLQDCELRIT